MRGGVEMKKLMMVAAAMAVLALGVVAVGGAVTSGQEATPTPTEEQPWLGAMLVQTPDGVTIAQVIADSPADAVGLQRGDVIKAIDGTEVDNVSDLRDQLDGKSVGDAITLSISRDGEAQDVSVTLEARPEPLSPALPLLPELEGIPVDELFSHFQGGEFNYTDAEGNTVTAVVEAGTVASVDADAGSLTVNLNAGGSKTYTVEESDLVKGGQLSDLEEGDNVTVLTVNDDVRAVFGGNCPFGPGFGGGREFGFGGMRRGPDGFGGLRFGPFSDDVPESSETSDVTA
jgi:membrane-associated protease RseP (regulator of RpoE activity)